VRARRVEAAAFVASTVLTNLELLSLQEAAVAKRDPVSAERAQAIIEDFVMVARNELRHMGA
jgi:hypothetical protein